MRRLLASLAVVPLLLLSACGDSSGGEDATATSTVGTTSLEDVTVSGEPGEKPTVEFATPLSITEADRAVVVEGEGEVVEEGQQVQAHLVTYDGATGEELESTFEQDRPAGFPMDPAQINQDLFDAVVGVAVGSRVLIAVPGQAQGEQPAGTALVVLDVLSAKVVPSRAEGTPVDPPEGLPAVSLAEDGAPTITLPEGDPPGELIVQPLITGEGPVVEQGQNITVQYTGVTWPGGEVFDSSWENGRTAQFPIGVGQVIAGWDAGLVGQPVGSQVLLVIPPDQGYGAEGQPSAGIEGTDTLVFVVDILDAS